MRNDINDRNDINEYHHPIVYTSRLRGILAQKFKEVG
jgi:hypothetical protein